MNFTESLKAQNYNATRDLPRFFLCQSTRQIVKPGDRIGVEWIERRQKQLSLEPDGMLGPKTLKAIERRYGPLSDLRLTVHPMPIWVSRWGYDHAHDHGEERWPYRDPTWHAFTDKGDWESTMLRLVSGFSQEKETFNRSPRSAISLDTLSMGFCHYWARTLPKHIEAVCKEVPQLSAEAFPGHRDSLDRGSLGKLLGEKKGKGKFQFQHAWLVSGWRHLMEQDSAIHAHVNSWLRKYVGKAWTLCKLHFGESCLHTEVGGQILAAVTRMVNSGPADRWIRKGLKKHRDPMRALEYVFNLDRKKGGYGKPERWDKITSWRGFRGSVKGLF
jgi:hypothetical protein